MTVKFATIPSKRLAASITAASTSIQLNNILTWDGVTNLTSADVGTQLYAVFRNDANTIIEIMELDGSTIANSSVTITRRGLKFDGTLLTEVSGNKLTWIKNETIVELGTDTPQFLQYLKEYIDGIAIAGSPDASSTAKGLVEMATQAEIDAGTAAGATSAKLAVGPDQLALSLYARGTNYYTYAADSVGTDAYAITVSPAPTAYAAGQIYAFKAGTANTGACTLNVNSLGAKTLKKNVLGDLETGDILADQTVLVEYDGTNMQVLSRLSLGVAGFGDGSDGDVTVSGTTNLTRDMFYNNLTVTGTLNTVNWRVFVRGTLSGNGTIQNNGGNGGNGGTPTAGTAGTAIADGYFTSVPGIAGATGTSNGGGSSGVAGTAKATAIGVVGVAGGNGGTGDSNGGGTGGAAGALTAPLQTIGVVAWQTISGIDLALNGTPAKWQGSTGSGSGAAGGADPNGNTCTSGGGGGSGAAGGIVFIMANAWTGTFTIKSTGGNGGTGGNGAQTGSGGAGGGGGGAGGSGGASVVIYGTKSWTGSYVLTGGTGGAGGTFLGANSTDGTAGATGTTGVSYEYSINALAR